MVGGADADGAHQTILDTTQTILYMTQTILYSEMDHFILEIDNFIRGNELVSFLPVEKKHY